MKITDKTYDFLRWLQDLLPIVATLTTTLMALYGSGEQAIAIVGGTFTAIITALVSFLRIARKNYDEVTE